MKNTWKLYINYLNNWRLNFYDSYLIINCVCLLQSWIFKSLPKRKQVIAVSATYPESLMTFVEAYMVEPYHARLDADHKSLLGLFCYGFVFNTLNLHDYLNFDCLNFCKMFWKTKYQKTIFWRNAHVDVSYKILIILINRNK